MLLNFLSEIFWRRGLYRPPLGYGPSHFSSKLTHLWRRDFPYMESKNLVMPTTEEVGVRCFFLGG